MAIYTPSSIQSGFRSTVALNTEFSNIAQILNNKLDTDGTVVLTADLDANNNKLINVAAGTNPGDAINFGQLQTTVTDAINTGLESVNLVRSDTTDVPGSTQVTNIVYGSDPAPQNLDEGILYIRIL